MWNRNLILWTAVLMLLSACSSRKTAGTAPGLSKELSKREAKTLVEGIENNRIAYESFSTKARTKLNVDNKSFNATLNIRIKSKEAIWISANAFLGIEAARILITPERIQIINRLQSTYVDRPFSYIYEFASAELTFEDLENLFVGNIPAFYDDPANKLLLAANVYQISGNTATLGYEFKLSPEFKLIHTLLSERSKQQSLSFSYDQYQNVGGIAVPGDVNLNLQAPKTKLTASMSYEDISFNENLSFPFQVPERYKKI